MAEHKDCKHYDGCYYRNDIGCCPNWCVQFKHKDDVRVVRCKDCNWYTEKENVSYKGHFCVRMTEFVHPNDFCSYGEKRRGGDGNA